MRRILRGSTLRGDSRRDVTDELQFHIDMRTQEFIDEGMSAEDARRAATRAFGDVSAIDAELRTGREFLNRERARRDRLQELAMDIRFALRTLRQNIGFTAATLATLALGIGAATAVFAVVNGVLLRPLPYPDPSRIELLWMTSKQYGDDLPVSSGFYSDALRASQSTAVTSAFRAWRYSLAASGAREVEQVDGARVTPSFFRVIGVRPALGRAFADGDAEVGAAPAVILSDALWRSDMGADPAVVGKQIELSGQRFTVVGVMPPGFTFPRGAEMPSGLQFGRHTQLWTPLGFTEQDRKNYAVQNLAVVARLKPGVSAERLLVVMSAELQRWLTAVAPKLDLHYKVVSLRDQAGAHVRRGLVFLLVAVGLLLCIACANVTNLLVARTARRQREFAVRAALGAGRGRIARQLVTENVMLAAAGSLIGLAVSIWATRAMLSLVPGSMPRADDIGVDWRVMGAVTIVAVLAGVVFGLAASTQAGLNRVATVLREDGSRSTGSRLSGIGRRTLVVAEVSLSLMLLIGAALLTVSFVRLQQVEPGFDPAHVLTADVSLPVPGAFDVAKDGPGWARFFHELQARLARSQGIEAAGGVSVLPLGDAAETGSTSTIGEPPPIPGKAHATEYLVVEGDYFRAMRIPLLGGRAFDASDLATSTPVVVVNREYARKYLGGIQPALTHQIRTFFDFGTGKLPRTVVGVVENVKNGALDAPAQPQVYVSEQQMNYPGLQIVLRTRGDPMAALPVLKRETGAIDPTLAVSRPRSMQTVFDESLARQRFSMTLIAFFAGAALVLAVIGLYGVISLSVNHRRREIGVRMALGARPTDVLRLVLGEGFGIATGGVVIGLVGAYAMSRLVTTLLYGVSATNAAVYAGAAVLTVLVTLGATLVPARRATRVDPTVALRGE
ncbi:MAG TPA: ABC transporter permease [Gemmatimonadaceae bacterium]|jgi:predicted permease|nr:ABC transporter permease [Gemmatimonadaceae bacterium]